VTTTAIRPSRQQLEAQLDEAITNGVARVLRLLTASGEIRWSEDGGGSAEERVTEVARVAVGLARLPEVEGAPPRSWLPARVTRRPPAPRTVRRRIRRRERAPRRFLTGQQPSQAARLPRWALGLAVASFVVLVVVLALQRL
jgi:hypothetical protein